MNRGPATPATFAFGRFRVAPHRRELLADGRPVKLGGRAFDVLMALIESPGAVVDKDALMQRVWPDRIVEENNLQAQISALRAAFGAERDLIRTVAGRGYQFNGDIRDLSARAEGDVRDDGDADAKPTPDLPQTNLPQAVSDLIGRDDDLRELLDIVAAHRFVTITGAGGIGKTTLALAAARELLPRFADGVWVAELAPLADGGLIPGVVARAVGLEFSGEGASADRVAEALGEKELLLVLDNCEHVLADAAILAEALLRTNPTLRIIATSRESLKAEGEWVYPAPSLAAPAADAGDDADPLEYGAVRLFVERVRAAQPHFAPDRRLAAVIAAICRRLDGIPLAIELAAARGATLGIEALAARLDDAFALLTGGRRTALPRHQTLRATLDWSYELLPEPERVVLRRLGVFPSTFRLESAIEVVRSPDIPRPKVVECLSNLVAKSLVAAEVSGTIALYRLLETTRTYAREKLGESGERDVVARLHAEYFRALFERAEAEWDRQPTAEWLAEYARQINNLRAALDWAFSPDGDEALGVALTAVAAPVWMHLSLAEELRSRVERALRVGAGGDVRCEMKLRAALAGSMLLTGDPAPDLGALWAKALELAERLGDAEYQLRTLWGLWAVHSTGSEHRAAVELAQRFLTLATKRPNRNEDLVGEQMIGVSTYFQGDLVAAQPHFERVLAHHSNDRSHIIRYQLDPRVTAGGLLARILWLRGFPEQGLRTAESTIEEADALNDANVVCFALCAGCSIALWRGDLDRAERHVERLLDSATQYALGRWRAVGRCQQAVLVMKQGDVDRGARLFRALLEELGDGFFVMNLVFHGDAAEGFLLAGQTPEGLAFAEQTVERCEQTEERWLRAELLRVRGELALLRGGPARSGLEASIAEDHFRQALDVARGQGALAWELRAAISLAQLMRRHGRHGEARSLLAPVYDRFTEGFDTADLKAAKALIDDLR